ncbi:MULTISPECIES: tetratricopeptide repeat protein [Paraburkholderia]|uniref:Tetratricopeptide repeat protein n=1 Tax=Paraburkholderia hospita TaxID=169430 RepID=A0AAN1MI83_9BURK|nr:tetratricopeptide repeat protein [Paraburkholderia hospita]AUT68063.1 tetratricopeptide repeat protein [Paraburkholderia hospita]SEI10237.1 Glycosyltransferase family 9 (heptosyltransferase) [Paraburkholderia hospita]
MTSQPDIDQRYAAAEQVFFAGDHDAARAHLDAVLQAQPGHAGALHLRGLVALEAKEPGGAAHWIEQALRARPDPIFYNSLSVVQIRSGALAEGAASAQRGLDLARSEPSVSIDTSILAFNLGVALQLNDDMEAAEHAYRSVISTNPAHSGAHNNLGLVLNALGDVETAIVHHRRAYELDPSNLEARSNIGHMMLAAGRYEEAWPHFEYRWAALGNNRGERGARPAEWPVPQWLGEASPKRDARLFIVYEQGLGDALQFSRFFPLALDRFATIGFNCPKPLRRLFEDSFGERYPQLQLLDDVPSDWSEWDCYSPMLSLPMALEIGLQNLGSAPSRYLRADPQRATYWRERLAAVAPQRVPRIGIVWAGGKINAHMDRMRSIAPAQVERLLAWPRAQWISLQKADDASKELTAAQRPNVNDWMSEIADFADTAALVEPLDLVIAVDTSVAHLAAAMGKRVWLLNRYAGCWRWLRERTDSPWYPGMRIFNQSERGNWVDVLSNLIEALEAEFPARA